MYYDAMPSETILAYKGVELYSVYRDDDASSKRLEYCFGTDPMVTAAENDDPELMSFDIRLSVYKSIPGGARLLKKPYRYDPDKTIQENMKELIDLGGIDYSNGRDVLYAGYGKITTDPDAEAIDLPEYKITLTDKRSGKTETFTSARDMLYHLGYFGVKLWNAEDICEVLEKEAYDSLGRNLTPAEESRIKIFAENAAINFAYLGGIDCLEDCTDAEWDGLLSETVKLIGDDWVEKIADKKEPKIGRGKIR